MAKFFQSENNGVVALIREDHAEKFGEITRAGGNPLKAGVRVFTFCDDDRLARNPEQRMYFTGTYGFAHVLTNGHEISHSRGDWSGYVPFSNQNYDADKEFATTAEDVIVIFRLVRSR